MKGKSIKSIICWSLIGILLSSCSQSDKFLIGFMVPNYQEARYAIDRDNFVKRAQELGAEVLVTNAENDDNKQIAQARELMNNGVKAIVIIAVNQITAAAIAREAESKDIKVVAYERLIQNCPLDLFISFDHNTAGRLMAEYAINKQPEGNYVIISGDKTDKNAELIEQGYEAVLAPHVNTSKIKVVFNTFIEDWSPEEAHVVMQKVLNYNIEPINVVLCANDGMAGGVIKALEERGLAGKVIVTGMDAELSACRRIIEGTQNITIYKPMTEQGKAAAENTIKILKGEKPEGNITYINNGKMDVPSIMLKPMVVDVKNIKETIIADGFHSENDIFNASSN
ncbi:MAG: substrate-binding domain-containing protein [Bacteroidales bacterium]|nr:substrate-binding domain-containing protein [Bacteroidales bacterium]